MLPGDDSRQIRQAGDISVKDVCGGALELLFSHQYLRQGSIPNGVKVVQSLPSAAA